MVIKEYWRLGVIRVLYTTLCVVVIRQYDQIDTRSIVVIRHDQIDTNMSKKKKNNEKKQKLDMLSLICANKIYKMAQLVPLTGRSSSNKLTLWLPAWYRYVISPNMCSWLRNVHVPRGRAEVFNRT